MRRSVSTLHLRTLALFPQQRRFMGLAYCALDVPSPRIAHATLRGNVAIRLRLLQHVMMRCATQDIEIERNDKQECQPDFHAQDTNEE